MRFPFKHRGEIVGHYELNPFPGVNQIVVSNHSMIDPEKRGEGLGKKLSREKLAQAKILGFDYMLATVVATNDAQLRIMEANGWKKLDTFFNRESGNTVHIFGQKLN